jgi:type III secretion system YscQ/HrcQ family protein
MDSTSQTEEIAHDPFAGDIFAANRKTAEEIAPEIIAPPISDWTRRLKKFPAAKINWNDLLNDLPLDFSEKIATHLAEGMQNLLNLPAENQIELLPLVKREINRSEDFPHFSKDSWWLKVFTGQTEAEFAVEIDTAFAVWLVDATLGEMVSEQINLRDLTETETSILEFLSLNLIYEANRALQSPVFKICSIERKIPDNLLAAQKNFAQFDAFLVLNWQIVHGLLSSIIKIYLSPFALKNLSARENSLLKSQTNWQRFQNQITDTRALLRLGEIDLTIAELASIETDDVVLLENYQLNIFGGNLFGRAEIFFADAENLKISGEILAPDAALPEPFEETSASAHNKTLVRKLSANQTLRFVVTGLAETTNPPKFKESMVKIDENLSGEGSAETADEGSGLAIENLALTLRVELEARRLTLAEIADLRENQIIELGVRPTDSVNLLIENRVVGRGELVEIEERLGIRITKLNR